MDRVAQLHADERRLLFEETAARMGVLPTLVEKDFWVCLCLERLPGFESGDRPRMVFRGGTSLSKCYGIIRRFSEDIDLTLNRHDLGFEGETDPIYAPSKSQSKRRRKRVQAKVEEYVSESLVPVLEESLASVLGAADTFWKLSYEGNGKVEFEFPGSGFASSEYLRENVRLEIGALADLEPIQTSNVQPYAADHFPDLFEDPSCPVTVIAAHRTLCDKLLLLHRLHHKEEEIPGEYARHYYDVAALYRSIAWEALSRERDLLTHAVNYEQMSYPRNDARYETMKRGSFRLVPREDQLTSLRADYRKISEEMLFPGGPTLEEVLATLEDLELELNRGAEI